MELPSKSKGYLLIHLKEFLEKDSRETLWELTFKPVNVNLPA
jgi:hypothetical protein